VRTHSSAVPRPWDTPPAPPLQIIEPEPELRDEYTFEPGPEPDELERALTTFDRLRANLETVVRGKPEQIVLVLTALACEGHVLSEAGPGPAKTILARALAGSVDGAASSRIQCTPDLQPTDVTGLAVYDQKVRDFEFRPGPVFTNVVLVDEINRAMPKT